MQYQVSQGSGSAEREGGVMARYIDGWMPHYSASSYAEAPRCVDFNGVSVGRYDHTKSGLGRMYTAKGELRKRYALTLKRRKPVNKEHRRSERALRQMYPQH